MQLIVQHRAQLAAAEALEAERARSTQLQQQLAELSASSTLQQRGSQAQLTDAQQHLAASTDEFKRLDVQLQQAQEELASRDADVAQLQGELNKVGSLVVPAWVAALWGTVGATWCWPGYRF